MTGPQVSVLPLAGPPSSGPPGPAPPGAPPPGAPPGKEPFQSALAEEWARTAPAEGHKSEGEDQNAGRSRRARAGPQEAGEPAAVANAAHEARTERPGKVRAGTQRAASSAKPQTRPPDGVRPEGKGSQEPDPAGSTAGGEANAAPGAPASDAAAEGKAPLPVPADPRSTPGKDAGATSAPAAAAPPAKAVPAKPGETGPRSGKGRPPRPPPRRSRRRRAQLPARASMRPRPRYRRAPRAPPRGPPAARSRQPRTRPGSRPPLPPRPPCRPSPPRESGSTVIAPAAQTSGVNGAAVVAQEGTGVRLQDMIDSVRTTIELSVRQGTSQARIALSPESLGDVRIHLTQSSAGLIARVTAGTADAARVLAQGHAELHQTLSGLGLSLLSLDIGLSGQGAWSEGRLNGGAQPQAAPAGKTDGEHDDGAEAIAPAEAGPSGPAKGDLVDVLA